MTPRPVDTSRASHHWVRFTCIFTSTAALALLSGCEAQRRASENAAVQETAQEIKRICALPQTERDAELERIKKESGIVLQCGKNQ